MTLKYLLIIDFPKFETLTAAEMVLWVDLGPKMSWIRNTGFVTSFWLFIFETGFRIRIHFLRIRIQRIRVEANTDPDTDPDPDPDPIRIQGFNDQKLKKITAEKKIKFFFDQKLQFTYP